MSMPLGVAAASFSFHRMLVVDGGIETEILGDPGAFLARTGDTNDAAAVNLADLPGDAAGGASGGGDNERFAFLGLGNFHAEKSSEAVDAEHAKEDRVRNERNLREFLEKLLRGRVNDDVVLQSRKSVTRSPFL